MQVIIPMTGYGSRFVAAGYKDLKPLIKVQGKTMIQWIVEGMYDQAVEFIFICRKEHILQNPQIKEHILAIAPKAKIYEIENWEKKGPVNDVLRASDIIKDDTPSIINYCDFYMSWDYKSFLKEAFSRDCEGAIPCYTGFHPHLIPAKNLYASCLVDENEDLLEIREKFSFAENKFEGLHSPGVYYFKSGKIMKHYCQRLIEDKNALNGEYYASLVYNNMVKDGLKVWVPANVEQFCQWGTPEDLREYLFWTEAIRRA